ncbi:type IV pilus twitching motility protein PilT [Idiomarina loihiensis]|uniref:type IV pilus twitching motility protein PilT n=1 Tax=Idiomarina loihiensis TaxID=135577 RepID=UPI00129C7D51|nr:type IV pilus twitching motility protein PilT [Idiomarina loihiensis]MRJ44733.1 PilT/PilU family type 4a pilus ATPase [Idiomarina loihiensis]UTW33308.1 type IV pilus twitching motility protein PilT [Idiomarina loihiensis]
MNVNELLAFSVKQNASDLHLSSGSVPMIRVDGDIRPLNQPEHQPDELKDMLFEVMTKGQWQEFEEKFECDFSFEIEGVARFRANVFTQRKGIAAAFRMIPAEVTTLEQLDAPEIFKDIVSANRGLVLVTGPTGSGKSTTLAAMVNYLNQNRSLHILTIEDPIEFVHDNQKSLVSQREVHRDTRSFSAALRSALREDPDVILVGEMRDLETIRLAMTAAETGHLVLGTLHTTSAPKTIDRIIDVFPGDDKPMIRSMLSESLRAVISQSLLKRVGGGRVAAHEIMLSSPAIKNLIREDKVAQMYSAIQTGAERGMQTLDQALKKLLARGDIEAEEARRCAVTKEDF